MPEPTTGYTVKDLKNFAALQLHWDRNADNWGIDQNADFNLLFKRAYNVFLHPSHRGKAYKWNFNRPRATLTTSAAYSTGTITVVNGAVTGAGTTFVADHANFEMIFGGGVYPVDTFGSTTALQLVDTAVDADILTAYQLVRPEYDLPDDFGGMEGDFTYQAGSDSYYGSITEIDDEWIQNRMQFGNPLVFPPQRFSLIPKAMATTGLRWQVRFHPMPASIYTLRYRYAVRPDTYAADGDYVYGGLHTSEALLACLLAEVEMYDEGQPGSMAMDRERKLAEAIMHDHTFAPDHLGMDGPKTRNGGRGGHYVDEYPFIGSVSYEGH